MVIFWTSSSDSLARLKSKCLRPVHTKNDNYKDNDISVHTSELYRLFILSASLSAALNSRARDSRIDYDWLSIFLSFISWKKIILKMIPMISFLCAFIIIAVVWTLLFFNIETIFRTISLSLSL